MITLENFSEANRSKTIGNSLYRICQNAYTKRWYIFEMNNDGNGSTFARDDYTSENLANIIKKFNKIKSEKEIIREAQK